MTAARTFIRAVEVWVPGVERTVLEFGGGIYGDAHRFAAISRTLCFGRGEGLPGQAWEQGRPIVLKAFAQSYFRRTAAAHAEGITCGIAVPIFAGDFLTSVLVVFCGDDGEHAGAIELWHNDPGTSRDLTLDDGYYGTTADTFEFKSRRTAFRKGHGLPGTVWETGLPEVVEDMGKAARFLRADSAQKVGINRGFAFAVPVRGDHAWVLAFLSALGTPIARRFEVWRPAAADTLRLAGGFCESAGALDADAGRAAVEVGQGTVGKAAMTGVPALTDDAGSEPDPVGPAAAALGFASLVAIPVIRDGRLAAVAVWYV